MKIILAIFAVLVLGGSIAFLNMSPAARAVTATDPIGTVRAIPMWNVSGPGLFLQPVERFGHPTDPPVWLEYKYSTSESRTWDAVCPTTPTFMAQWTGTRADQWTMISEEGATRPVFVFKAEQPTVVLVYFGRFQISENQEVHLQGQGLEGYSVVAMGGTFRCLKANDPTFPARPLPPITGSSNPGDPLPTSAPTAQTTYSGDPCILGSELASYYGWKVVSLISTYGGAVVEVPKGSSLPPGWAFVGSSGVTPELGGTISIYPPGGQCRTRLGVSQ